MHTGFLRGRRDLLVFFKDTTTSIETNKQTTLTKTHQPFTSDNISEAWLPKESSIRNSGIL